MPALASTRKASPAPQRTAAHRTTAAVVGAAAAAAVVAYAAHHLGPLRAHAAVPIVIALAVAMLVAAVPALIAAAPTHLPHLVVAAPGSSVLRVACAEDAAFCAALHSDTLGHGFFTQLGPPFLRAYHRTFVDSPHAVALVATVSDVRVGMVVGAVRPASHARWVLHHHGVRLALLGALGLAVRPLTSLRFARTRARRYLQGWRRNRRAERPAPLSPDEPGLLSHVAVLRGARGAGIGRQLVDGFVAALRAELVTHARLVTLDDDGAGNFYAQIGWRRGQVCITPDGRRMVEWLLAVEPQPAA